MSTNILNDIALTIGKKYDENNHIITINNVKKSEQVIKKLENNHMSDNILPGVKTDIEIESDDTLKKQALDNLIKSAANAKLKKEKNTDFILKHRVKEYVINSIVDTYKQEFLVKNGYSLIGKDLKKIIKHVTTRWNKGRIKLSPQQIQEILDYLNLPSNEIHNDKNISNETEKPSVTNVISSSNKII